MRTFLLLTAFCCLTVPNGWAADADIATPMEDEAVAKVDLPGIWVTYDAETDIISGFLLKDDGTAASVNMHTLTYTAWKTDGQTLSLTLTSRGNGVPETTKMDYTLVSCENDKLVLRDSAGQSTTYRRISVIDTDTPKTDQ